MSKLVSEELVALVSDEEIEAAAGNANFGTADKRDMIGYGVLQFACGYRAGHTLTTMLMDLGLIGNWPRNHRDVPALRAKGKKYLWACFGKRSY